MQRERYCEAFADRCGIAVIDDWSSRLGCRQIACARTAAVGRAAASRSGCRNWFRSSMRNPLDKSSVAQSLDDQRLKGSLHFPAEIITADRTLQAIGSECVGRNPPSQGRVRRTLRAEELRLERAGAPFFWSWRRSLAASASSQSRKVTIFGSARRRLRTDDPVGLGQRQRLGKRPHQSAIDEIPRPPAWCARAQYPDR